MHSAESARLQRFHLLDILRGLASLSVILWHYQHFYYMTPGMLPKGFARADEPLYGLLSVFYNYGYAAVALFFVISGFVFYYNYRDAVADREVPAFEFFVLRFSRLYPLHFATLVAVAVGQFLAWSLTGQFIVYVFNDTYHFVLNLFFASYWGLDRGFSFNAPIWSVSIEVVLYAIFFVQTVLVRHWRRPAAMPVILLLAGLGLTCFGHAYPHLVAFGEGLMYFNLGCLIADGYRGIEGRSALRLPVLAVSAICGVAGVAAFTVTQDTRCLALAFLGLVAGLAILQDRFRDAGRRWHLIGDITYATYLVHFPVQLFTILLLRILHVRVNFSNPAALLLFLAVVILVAIPVYSLFEMPAQNRLRRLLLKPALVAAA